MRVRSRSGWAMMAVLTCGVVTAPRTASSDAKVAPATICRGSTQVQQDDLTYDVQGWVLANDLAGVVCPLVTDTVANPDGLSELKLWVDPDNASDLTCTVACMSATGSEQDTASDTTVGTGQQVLDYGSFSTDCDSHGTYVLSCVLDSGDKLHAVRWVEN